MKFTILLFLAILAIACHTKKEQQTNEATSCYTYTENRDTVKMTLTIANKNVTGELTYRLFEKDRNDGHFNGVMSGDTIIADYEFESEGMRSVREVIFLKRGTAFVEGFGPTDSSGARFLTHRELTFSGIELHKCDCSATH